nr:reverse transcriptase domain-containing protein [Tanacetum cinerariifolium]
LKGITTRSGIAYQGPKTPSPSKQGTKVTKEQVQNPSSQNIAPVQPLVIQSESQALVSEPVVAPVSTPMPNLKPSIPYPSRRDNEKCQVEPKDLPHHLEYTFLEGNNKLPVIIAKELGSEEKAALIKVLKSHKRAIAWKLSDIQANKIDIIYEVLGFSDTTASGNPTPHDDPIVSTMSPTLTLFGDSDFLLFEEADAFLGLE